MPAWRLSAEPPWCAAACGASHAAIHPEASGVMTGAGVNPEACGGSVDKFHEPPRYAAACGAHPRTSHASCSEDWWQVPRGRGDAAAAGWLALHPGENLTPENKRCRGRGRGTERIDAGTQHPKPEPGTWDTPRPGTLHLGSAPTPQGGLALHPGGTRHPTTGRPPTPKPETWTPTHLPSTYLPTRSASRRDSKPEDAHLPTFQPTNLPTFLPTHRVGSLCIQVRPDTRQPDPTPEAGTRNTRNRNTRNWNTRNRVYDP